MPVYEFLVQLIEDGSSSPISVIAPNRHEAVGIKALWERDNPDATVEIEPRLAECPVCGRPYERYLQVDVQSEIESYDHVQEVYDTYHLYRHKE